jgi:membrane protease YdiL (CAAX protease family)
MRPSRLLLEMLLFFLAFFLPGYLAQVNGPGPGPLSTTTMLLVIVTGLPQFLLMAYVVGALGPGPAERWGMVRLRGGDLAWMGILVLCCFAVVGLFFALALALPPAWRGAMTRGYRWGLQGYAQVPLALLFGLTAGYREEFFFRSYLLGRMKELGIPVPLAAVVSTLLFCMGHLYEGPVGIAVAAVLGSILCISYILRPNLHVVAIAHGLYNATVLVLSIPLSRALPALQSMGIFSSQ